MSTTKPPSSPQRIERSHGRIRHPLDRLRKYINAYVFLEALGLFSLVLVIAFWLGLLSDYGMFRAFTFDWVESAPWGFRLLVLSLFAAFMIGLVLLVSLTRFFKEFRDAALALVLERRFPNVLGDRLITAVELHNPKQAAKYGYSPELVAHTIHEAADRVEQVPVAQVFAWKRLWTYGIVLLYLSIGLYALSAAGFCANRSAKNQPIMEGVSDFNEVAGIWTERNILLRNVIWPRSVHLELLPIDPARRHAETRIARDQPAPNIRVRAWKYVVADRSAPEGWRLLLWKDVQDRPSLIGDDAPDLPKGWEPRDKSLPSSTRFADAGAAVGLGHALILASRLVATTEEVDLRHLVAVDEVELKLNAFVMRKKLSGGESAPAKYNTQDPDGTWRPLVWSDLTKEKLGDLEVPTLPAHWSPHIRAAGFVGVAAHPVWPDCSVGCTYSLLLIMADRHQEKFGYPLKSLAIEDVRLLAERELQAAQVVKEQLEKLAKQDPSVAASAKQAATEFDKLNELNTDIGRAIAHLDKLAELRETLDLIEAKASDRAMSRTLRKLTVPQTVGERAAVTLVSRGEKTRKFSTVSMTPVGDNEFTGNFGELKETANYYATAADYVTPPKRLVVVELPRIERLETLEERPAYLSYRPTDVEKPGELRGKRQQFQPSVASLSGDVTTIEVVAGTYLKLTASVSKPLLELDDDGKPLENPVIIPEKKFEKTHNVGSVTRIDSTTFTLDIPNIRTEQRFTFEFMDEDNVKGRRSIAIIPREDAAPRIREFNPDDVVRRVKEGFMVTPNCRIPFKGRVRDDHGLSRVRYACRVIPADFVAEQKILSLYGVAGLPIIGRPETRWQGAAYMALMNRVLASVAKDDPNEEQFIKLPEFDVLVDVHPQQHPQGDPDNPPAERMLLGKVMSLLGQRQKDPYRRLLADFTLTPDKWTEKLAGSGPADPKDITGLNNPDDPRSWLKAEDRIAAKIQCDLPLWELRHKGEPLKEQDPSRPQKRYFVEVRLIAEDTYTEGEIDEKTGQPKPNSSPSSETFTFVVVPDNELLGKVAEEEEARERDLIRLLKPLADSRDRITELTAWLGRPAEVKGEQFAGMVARCDALDELLKVGHTDTIALRNAYERIVREYRINQIENKQVTDAFTELYLPLREVTNKQFERTMTEVRSLRRMLDNKDLQALDRATQAAPKARDTHRELNKLVADLQNILMKMKGISEFSTLLKDLVDIAQQQERLERAVKNVKGRVERELLGLP